MFCPFTTKDAKVHEGKSTSLSEIEGGFLPGHISAGKHGTPGRALCPNSTHISTPRRTRPTNQGTPDPDTKLAVLMS